MEHLNEQTPVVSNKPLSETSSNPLKRKQADEKASGVAVSIIGLSNLISPEKKVDLKRQRTEFNDQGQKTRYQDLVQEILIHPKEALPPEFHSAEFEIQGNWLSARLLPPKGERQYKGENQPAIDVRVRITELFTHEVNLPPGVAFESLKDLEKIENQDVKSLLLDAVLEKGYQMLASMPQDETLMRDQENVWVIVNNLIESNHVDKAKEIISRGNLQLETNDQIKLLKAIAHTSSVEECLGEFRGMFVGANEDSHHADVADMKFKVAIDLALIFTETGRHENGKEFIKAAGPFIYKLPDNQLYADPQKTQQLVTFYAKGNEIKNALILAKKITDHRYRASAFITIIEEEAYHKPQVATKMALEIFINEKDKFFKNDALVLDVMTLRNGKKVKFDYQSPINGVSYALQALVKIAKVEETHNHPEEAFETLNLIFSVVQDHQDDYHGIDLPDRQQLGSRVISLITSLGHYQEAMDAAHSLELNSTQASLLIAEEMLKQYKNSLSTGNYERAQKIQTYGLPLVEQAYQVAISPSPLYVLERETLKEIASLNAEFGGKRELSILPYNAQDFKFNHLLESATAIKALDPEAAKHQLERAVAELAALEVPGKASHFVEIVKVMASIDFRWAWNQTERVPESFRDPCLIELVKLKCGTNLAMGVGLASSTKFKTEKNKAKALAETLLFFK